MFEPPFLFSTVELPRLSAARFVRAVNCGLYTFGGLFFLALGIVGVYLPGIPATGPVLLALILITRGNPHLRQRLRKYSMLDKYFQYLEGTRVMTARTRIIAASCMWVSITASCVALSLTFASPNLPIAGCVVGGVIGSVVIYRFGPMRTGSL